MSFRYLDFALIHSRTTSYMALVITKDTLGWIMMANPRVSTSELGLACTQRLPVSLAAGRGVMVVGA